MTRRSVAALLLIVAACSPSESADRDAPAGEERVPARDPVELAVQLYTDLTSEPEKADSILAAAGLTEAGLDSLIYDISIDSAMAARYAARINELTSF